MALSIENLFEQVKQSLEQNYLTVLDDQLTNETRQIQKILQAADEFSKLPIEDNKNHDKIAAYKSQLHILIDEKGDLTEVKKFSEKYEALFGSFQAAFDALEVTQTYEQSKERFQALEEDTTWLKVVKPIKKAVFQISRVLLYLSNLFKKKKENVPFWNQTVLLKNLAIRHFQSELVVDLQGVTNIFFRGLNTQYLMIKEWEEALLSPAIEGDQPEPKEVVALTETFKTDLLAQIHELVDGILKNRIEAFQYDYQRAGTMELPGKKLSNAVTAKQLELAEKKWLSNNQNWKNATYALFEEWRSDLDIYTLKHKTLSELDRFQLAQVKRFAEHIDPEVNEIAKFINEAIESLKKESDSVQKELKRINYQADKKLNLELVPKLCDKLSGQNIVNLINKLEIGICRSVEQLSDEHVMVKTNSYNEPIETDGLSKISPYELIAFEALVKLQKEISVLKKELFTSLERATAGSTDIDHIVTFSLSSAISTLAEEGKTEEEALSIAQEGLTRALNRLTENRQELDESMQKNSEQLAFIIGAFCDSLMELTVNENVRELRLRIAKAKASKQAIEVREQLKEKLLAQRKSSFNTVKENYQKLKTFLTQISQKFILTASKPALTKEVSDFLMESQQAIDKLPLIYRRLYKIEPLEDLELFEGREEEFETLKVAFQNWDQGKFAATAILGEKWGGLTTFINYATKKAGFSYVITRFTAEENLYSGKQFIALMKIVFKNETFENLGQVVDHINEGPKRVVILEDLQNMYLRKVGGFEALQSLFQLMTQTSNKVFWVTTTTVYTWAYLGKVINIRDYFSYTIVLGELTNDQIVNIIWKRNRISGFNIRFELPEDSKEDKNFKGLEEVEQQAVLKEKFIAELNKFAKSNVSLALIFWLLSTRSLDDNTITIGMFQKPDLNFLSILSMDKVHVLHAIILHDGLSEHQLSQVLSILETQSRLILFSLLEDGIIFKKGVKYMVNPIVYRNTIGLLTLKNLIH